MSKTRHAAISAVVVFLAVAGVLLGVTAALAFKNDHRPASAAASTVSVHRSPTGLSSGRPAPGSLMSQIPDTSIVAGNTALHTKHGTFAAGGTGFLVERVALPKPVRVTIDGTNVTAHWVYRLTITGGTWTPRDLAPVVWLDRKPLAVGMESRDLSSLMAFTFDESILTKGARLQVGYGLPGAASAVWTSTIEVVR